MLIAGYVPSVLPSEEFVEILKQLRRIGVNINQIAYKANSMGTIDSDSYHRDYLELQSEVSKIKQYIAMPKKWRSKYGDN